MRDQASLCAVAAFAVICGAGCIGGSDLSFEAPQESERTAAVRRRGDRGAPVADRRISAAKASRVAKRGARPGAPGGETPLAARRRRSPKAAAARDPGRGAAAVGGAADPPIAPPEGGAASHLAGTPAGEPRRPGGILAWMLGLLVAAVVGFVGWLALQPPWRRWRWWGTLKARLRTRLGGLRARWAGAGTTTSTWSPGDPAASARRARAVRLDEGVAEAGGPGNAQTAADGSADAAAKGPAVVRARRRRLTGVTLPVITGRSADRRPPT